MNTWEMRVKPVQIYQSDLFTHLTVGHLDFASRRQYTYKRTHQVGRGYTCRYVHKVVQNRRLIPDNESLDESKVGFSHGCRGHYQRY